MARIEESRTHDAVIQEIRQIKEALAQSQDFDLRRILDEAREKQKASHRTILSPPAKAGQGA